MNEITTKRAAYDLLMYRWMENGQRQHHAKKTIVKGENKTFVTLAREHFSIRAQEAGEIRDAIIESFVKDTHVLTEEFCDEYEMNLRLIWTMNNNVEKYGEKIIDASDETTEEYFRGEAKESESTRDELIETVYRMLTEAAEKEQMRIA